MDAWEIPDRHRQAVHLMTPADTFPFSPSTSRTMQIDHTEPYVPKGPDQHSDDRAHGHAHGHAGVTRAGSRGWATTGR